MRTNIDIDEALVSEAMRRTRPVHEDERSSTGLYACCWSLLATMTSASSGAGSIWEGNLDEMRQGRSLEPVEPA